MSIWTCCPSYRDARGYSLTRAAEVADHAGAHEAAARRPERASPPSGDAALSSRRTSRRLADRLARFYRAEEARPETSGNLRASVERISSSSGRSPGDACRLDSSASWNRSRGVAGHVDEPARLSTFARRARRSPPRARLLHARGPLAIDCIEFLDRFRIADPALDVAFLAMDLARNGRRELGEFLLGRFAYESDDYDFFPLADGYMIYRACVRAKVACFLAADESTPPETGARARRESPGVLRAGARPRAGRSARQIVFAVGGVIGSGKTTVAEQLSRSTGAPLVSADATRKFLAGIPREEKGAASIYSAAFSERVRNELPAARGPGHSRADAR